MLSDIIPEDVLTKHGNEVKLSQPEINQNMYDHATMPTAWKAKNLSAGQAYVTNSSLFNKPQYELDNKVKFLATMTLPKEGLAAAIARHESVETGPDHPLLRQDRALVPPLLQCNCASVDGSSILMLSTVLTNSSCGCLGTSLEATFHPSAYTSSMESLPQTLPTVGIPNERSLPAPVKLLGTPRFMNCLWELN
ncbi:glucose dehydrogenase [Colletotrichum tofieldiae]|nr:glucose dehydrogenase [Colletotrichum tofieldiae]